MRPVTVLMTGAGAPGAPGIIYGLRRARERNVRIVGVDADGQAAGFSLTDAHYTVPPGESSSYIPEMLRIAQAEQVDVLLPLVDHELQVLSDSKADFAGVGTRVCLSEPWAIAITGDKYRTMQTCEQASIPVPEYRLVRTCDGFVAAAEAMGYPDRLVCFKPPVSNGGRGFRILDAQADERDLLLHYKAEDNLRLRLGRAADILASQEPFPQLLVMEYLSGKEHAVDALLDSGVTLVAVPRVEERKKSGNSIRSRTVCDRDLMGYMERLGASLCLHGPIGIQVRQAADGTHKLLECNPRLHGASCTATAAGVNLPYLAVKQTLGEPFDVPKPAWGVRMIRYAKEHFEESGEG